MDSVIYKSVRGTWLRDRNEKTKQWWDECLDRKNEDGHPLIVDVTSDKDDPMFMVIDHTFEHLLGLCEDAKDPYGIENVNFSQVGIEDSRWDKYKEQREKCGFDDTELWNLDSTICKFIIPRLKRFREITEGSYPGWCGSWETWACLIDKMIAGFENILDNEITPDDEERYKIITEGMKVFSEDFRSLWY